MPGWPAAVIETVSPSQLMPSEIQRMWTSSTPGPIGSGVAMRSLRSSTPSPRARARRPAAPRRAAARGPGPRTPRSAAGSPSARSRPQRRQRPAGGTSSMHQLISAPIFRSRRYITIASSSSTCEIAKPTWIRTPVAGPAPSSDIERAATTATSTWARSSPSSTSTVLPETARRVRQLLLSICAEPAITSPVSLWQIDENGPRAASSRHGPPNQFEYMCMSRSFLSLLLAVTMLAAMTACRRAAAPAATATAGRRLVIERTDASSCSASAPWPPTSSPRVWALTTSSPSLTITKVGVFMRARQRADRHDQRRLASRVRRPAHDEAIDGIVFKGFFVEETSRSRS